MVPLRALVDARDTALWIAMPSRSAEVDPFTRPPEQLARDQVEAIRSPVPDALPETVREIGGRFGIRNIRVRLARAKDESIHSRHDGGLQFIWRRGPATPEGAGRRHGPPSIPGAVSARTRSFVEPTMLTQRDAETFMSLSLATVAAARCACAPSSPAEADGSRLRCRTSCRGERHTESPARTAFRRRDRDSSSRKSKPLARGPSVTISCLR